MLTRGISKSEQVSSARINSEGLPKKQVGGEHELVKGHLYAHYRAFFIECSIGKMA